MEVLEDVESCVEAEVLLEVEEGGHLHLPDEIFLAEPEETHGRLDWVDPGAREPQDSAQVQENLHWPHVSLLNLDHLCLLLTERSWEHCSEHWGHCGQGCLFNKNCLAVWFRADDEFQSVRILTTKIKQNNIFKEKISLKDYLRFFIIISL